MNPEEVLIEVEAAIKARPFSGSDHFDLVMNNGKLFCRCRSNMLLDDQHIFKITPSDLRDGFTSSQWSLIKERIAIYMERFEQWQKTQRH